MSAYPSLPLFTDAFIADTGHLSAQETGAYLMLLMMAWRLPDCRLPDDDARLARWARVDARTWRRIKPLVMEFWRLEDGSWLQGRLLKERDIVSKRAEVARENGKHGGRPKSLENNDTANPQGFSRATQQKAPNPNPREIGSSHSSEPCPKRQRIRTDYPNAFERFWVEYPTDANMSKKEAFDAWKRLSDQDQQLALDSLPAFQRYCSSNPDYRPIHAGRYLAKHRFEGHVAVAKEIEARKFVECGTPQWRAWQDHLIAQRGRGSPSTQSVINGRRADGWHFPSEWPPRCEGQAA